MCGIVGLVAPEGAIATAPPVRAMMNAVRHRGPDGEGCRLDGPCGLGHLRLSIIDQSPAAAQPMANEDGRLWLVFNGEIYNYVELTEELRAKGHLFRSRADSEVILHGFEEWGERCLDRFIGMWAFAVWDRKARTLFCARDRAGIKPFYYTMAGGAFHFASEIKALLALPEVPRRLDPARLGLFLKYHAKDFDERTCFEGISQLPPAHSLTLRGGKLRVARYWSMPNDADAGRPRAGTEGPQGGRFRALLEDSVRLHLRSDVPVGTCLSGGLDSSVLTWEAARQLRSPLRTFSIIYPGTAYDESRYVHAMLAAVPNLESHTDTPGGKDVFDVLRRTVRAFDEPTWGPAVYSWWHLMRLVASSHTKVVLGGQGSDELLAGYPAYYPTFLRQLALTGEWGTFRREAAIQAAAWGTGMAGLLRTLAIPLWPEPLRRLARGVGRGATFDDSYLSADFLGGAALPDDRRVRKGFLTLREHLQCDFTATRLPELLHAEDRFSMAFGIESRTPFLHRGLVEFASRLPDHARLADGRTKVVLREAYRGRLPDEIVDRRDKMGYPTPGEYWLAEYAWEEVSDLFGSAAMTTHGVFDAGMVRGRWERFAREGTPFPALWRIVSTEMWMRETLDAPAPPAVS